MYIYECTELYTVHTLKKDMEELKMSFIRCNYPINLLNRLFAVKPNRPKLSLASQNIVYVGIKYYNNKSVKFAQRLAKIIYKYYEVVKVVPYYKTGRKLLSYFFSQNKEFCARHIRRCVQNSVHRLRTFIYWWNVKIIENQNETRGLQLSQKFNPTRQ